MEYVYLVYGLISCEVSNLLNSSLDLEDAKSKARYHDELSNYDGILLVKVVVGLEYSLTFLPEEIDFDKEETTAE